MQKIKPKFTVLKFLGTVFKKGLTWVAVGIIIEIGFLMQLILQDFYYNIIKRRIVLKRKIYENPNEIKKEDNTNEKE